ncbi:hypothetical protein [Rhodohalobacter sp. 614A]|uniref:hypothetical protein n=1 Tax=Rhodohalobacter sp. 614A TaxID=2908649 RepID=UPI001F48FE79|nr:hypothetical protein [Rhodohalobacter sp. 614A]
MDKQTKKKAKIAETAAKRYIENSRFTIQSLTKELDMKSAEIFELFPNRKSILLFFYESRLLAYREQTKSIQEYSEFTLSEKLSNLFLTLLDQFMEYREFVLNSYNQFISKNPSCTSFEREFKAELQSIFQSDQNLSGSSRFFVNRLLYTTIYYHFHALLLFWENDDSEKYEQSFALVDKWCSLIEELFYSKVVDKGFDFGKFLFYNSPFKHATSSFKSNGD